MTLRRKLSHPSRRAILLLLCEQYGVTPERLLAIIERRKHYRRARYYRKRSRRRVMGFYRQPTKLERRERGLLLAGEGRFHELLKIAALDQVAFAHLCGMHPNTVKGWDGHPLHRWPELVLELLLWKQNVVPVLVKNGYDPDTFNAGHLPPAPQGRYPRTTEQGRKLIENIIPKEG